MNISFSKPLADAANFPAPKIFGLPTHLSSHKGEYNLAGQDNFSRLYLNSARNSLFIMGKYLEKKTVWVPSYHCPALIEPFIANNYEIKFLCVI